MKVFLENAVIVLATLALLAIVYWQIFGYEPFDSALREWAESNRNFFVVIVTLAGIYSMLDFRDNVRQREWGDAIQNGLVILCFFLFLYLLLRGNLN